MGPVQLLDAAAVELLDAVGRVVHDNRLTNYISVELLPPCEASQLPTAAAGPFIKLLLGVPATLLDHGTWKRSGPAAATVFKQLYPCDAELGRPPNFTKQVPSFAWAHHDPWQSSGCPPCPCSMVHATSCSVLLLLLSVAAQVWCCSRLCCLASLSYSSSSQRSSVLLQPAGTLCCHASGSCRLSTQHHHQRPSASSRRNHRGFLPSLSSSNRKRSRSHSSSHTHSRTISSSYSHSTSSSSYHTLLSSRKRSRSWSCSSSQHNTLLLKPLQTPALKQLPGASYPRVPSTAATATATAGAAAPAWQTSLLR